MTWDFISIRSNAQPERPNLRDIALLSHVWLGLVDPRQVRVLVGRDLDSGEVADFRSSNTPMDQVRLMPHAGKDQLTPQYP
jgi:hypothetical protein